MSNFVVVSADTRDVCGESPVFGVLGFDSIEDAERKLWERFQTDLASATSICTVKVNGDTVISVDEGGVLPLDVWTRYTEMSLDEARTMHGCGTPNAIWRCEVVVYTDNGSCEGVYHEITML